GIIFQVPIVEMYLDSVDFEDNFSHGNCAAVICSKGEFVMNNVHFVGNQCPGGAGVFSLTDSEVEIDQAAFSNNSGTYGVWTMTGCSVKIASTKMKDN